jgi:hypothetical protein
MLLGHVLERLGDEAFAAETLVGMDDLPLIVDVESVGAHFGESLPAYAVGATRRFAAFASDEDWLALMNALERARNPGAACLHHMLTWSLARDREEGSRACGCGADCLRSAE